MSGLRLISHSDTATERAEGNTRQEQAPELRLAAFNPGRPRRGQMERDKSGADAAGAGTLSEQHRELVAREKAVAEREREVAAKVDVMRAEAIRREDALRTEAATEVQRVREEAAAEVRSVRAESAERVSSEVGALRDQQGMLAERERNVALREERVAERVSNELGALRDQQGRLAEHERNVALREERVAERETHVLRRETAIVRQEAQRASPPARAWTTTSPEGAAIGFAEILYR